MRAIQFTIAVSDRLWRISGRAEEPVRAEIGVFPSRKRASPDAGNSTKSLLDADLATTIEAERQIHTLPHPEIKG